MGRTARAFVMDSRADAQVPASDDFIIDVQVIKDPVHTAWQELERCIVYRLRG